VTVRRTTVELVMPWLSEGTHPADASSKTESEEFCATSECAAMEVLSLPAPPIWLRVLIHCFLLQPPTSPERTLSRAIVKGPVWGKTWARRYRTGEKAALFSATMMNGCLSGNSMEA